MRLRVLFYSIVNIFPFVLLILHYIQKKTNFLEQVSNGPSFSIVLVFNFTLLIIIHYYFLKAFRESSVKEKALFANLEKSLRSLQLLMEKKDEFLIAQIDQWLPMIALIAISFFPLDEYTEHISVLFYIIYESII